MGDYPNPRSQYCPGMCMVHWVRQKMTEVTLEYIESHITCTESGPTLARKGVDEALNESF